MHGFIFFLLLRKSKMRILPPFQVVDILLVLLAASHRPHSGSSTTWFLDGNNILAYKGTPRDCETLLETLAHLQGSPASTERIVVVLDGRPGTMQTEVSTRNTVNYVQDRTSLLQLVTLAENVTADEYILQQCAKVDMSENPCRRTSSRKVQVVTADRELRRQLWAMKPSVVRVVVNPLTFWRKYVPRLCGFKRNNSTHVISTQV